MTMIEALKMAEDLLEKVCAAGEDNWNRLSDSKKLVQAVRIDMERMEARREAARRKQETEKATEHGSGDEKPHGVKKELIDDASKHEGKCATDQTEAGGVRGS